MANSDAEKGMRAHKRSYNLFLAMMKWGTVVSAIVALLVIFLIAS